MSARQVNLCIARTASEPFIILGSVIAVVGLVWLIQTGWSSVFVPRHSVLHSSQTAWFSPLLLTGFGLLFGALAWFWRFLTTRAIQSLP